METIYIRISKARLADPCPQNEGRTWAETLFFGRALAMDEGETWLCPLAIAEGGNLMEWPIDQTGLEAAFAGEELLYL